MSMGPDMYAEFIKKRSLISRSTINLELPKVKYKKKNMNSPYRYNNDLFEKLRESQKIINQHISQLREKRMIKMYHSKDRVGRFDNRSIIDRSSSQASNK